MEPLEKLDEVFELDSDQECDLRPIDSDDSDDDFSQDLVQRLQHLESQRTRSKRRGGTKDAAEDEFERAVNAELSASLAEHCRRLAPRLAHGGAPPAASETDSRGAAPATGTPGTGQPGAAPAGTPGTRQPGAAPAGTPGTREPGAAPTDTPGTRQPEQRYYDDVYFDSDDDSAPEEAAGPRAADSESAAGGGAAVPPDPASADRGGRRAGRRRPVLSDDQLLYDPEQDDRDQQWVDRQRRRYQPTGPPAPGTSGGGLQSRPGKLPHSDAVLNCPACMTMLCLDCQRHELYSNQYRAMFVFNCAVDSSQALRYRLRERRRARRGGAEDGRQSPAAGPQELFNPVTCATCKTEVAVYDSDEVYHFFNVIASHS